MVWGGAQTQRGTEESLWGPWRAFVVSVKNSCVKTIKSENVLCFALYVSFHAGLRKDGLSYHDALQRHHTEARTWIYRECYQELGSSQATEHSR